MEHAAAAAPVGTRTDGHALSASVLGRVAGRMPLSSQR